MAEFTRRQFTRNLGDFGVSEVWNTYSDGYVLADVDHYNGAISSVTVYDPTTGHSRAYSQRPKHRAMAIVERHLAAQGYKKCVEFHKLDGTVEFD